MVGDLVGEDEAQEHAVVGETPNLAARLQALAQPDDQATDRGGRPGRQMGCQGQAWRGCPEAELTGGRQRRPGIAEPADDELVLGLADDQLERDAAEQDRALRDHPPADLDQPAGELDVGREAGHELARGDRIADLRPILREDLRGIGETRLVEGQADPQEQVLTAAQRRLEAAERAQHVAPDHDRAGPDIAADGERAERVVDHLGRRPPGRLERW